MAIEPVITIHRKFKRPAAKLLQQFAGIPTGFLCDAMNRRGALDPSIQPVGSFKPFVGTALTVKGTAADNLAAHVSMSQVKPGDVVIVGTEGFLDCAVFGDNMVGMWKNCGALAVVTDGAIRDVHEIRKIGLPVYARGVTPDSPFKNGPGTIGGTISFGGAVIEAGDIVIGDDDGIVIVPQKKAAEVLKALEAVKDKESKQGKNIAGGLKMSAWVGDFIEKGGVRYAD